MLRSTIRTESIAVIAILVFALAGCSQQATQTDPDLVMVQGRLIDGNVPLAGVVMLFEPDQEGLRARGITDPDGKFAVMSENNSPGIALGSYTIVLKLPPIPLSGDRQRPSLARFDKTDSSPIRATVTLETQSLEIDLKNYEKGRAKSE